MHEAVLFVLLALACYRVTRLVTTDKITEPIFEPLRQRLENRWQRKHYPEYVPDAIRESETWNSKLAFMLSCPWCLGFWVSGVGSLVVSSAYGLDYLMFVLLWFAASTVIGMIGSIDSE